MSDRYERDMSEAEADDRQSALEPDDFGFVPEHPEETLMTCDCGTQAYYANWNSEYGFCVECIREAEAEARHEEEMRLYYEHGRHGRPT